MRHPGRLFGAGRQEVRVPQLPLRRSGAHRLGHGRVPLRRRPEAHLQDSLRGRKIARLDGRLRRPVAPGRGSRVRGAEELHAGPPRAEDEGRHRRHVRLRAAPRGGLQIPKPRGGARAGRFRAHRGRGDRGGLRRGALHPRSRRGHTHGRRLLQQQGAAGQVHPHGRHGLRLQLPHRKRDRRVLPHGAGRGSRRVRVQQLRVLRRRRGLAGGGRYLGPLPLRRDDPALPPAVADHRPVRQPPALHGLPRGRGRGQRHLRPGRSGHHPDDAAGTSLLHRLRRELRGPSGRVRPGALPQAHHPRPGADREGARALPRLAPRGGRRHRGRRAEAPRHPGGAGGRPGACGGRAHRGRGEVERGLRAGRGRLHVPHAA